jgi:hypothetical protein
MNTPVINGSPTALKLSSPVITLTVRLPGPVVPAWVAALLESILTSPGLRLVSITEQPGSTAAASLPSVLRLWDALVTRGSRARLPNAAAPVVWRERCPDLAKLGSKAPHDLAIDLTSPLAADSAPQPGLHPNGTWRYEFQSPLAGSYEGVSALETLTGPSATTYVIRVDDWGSVEPPAPFFQQDSRGWFRQAQVDTHSLSLMQNRNEVLWHAATFLSQVIGAAARLGFLKTATSATRPRHAASPTRETALVTGDGERQAHAHPDRAPRLSALLPRHVTRVACNSLCRAARREQWVLLWGTRGPMVDSPPRHRLQPPPDRFWADPHVLERPDGLHVFVEEFPYDSGRGRIALLTRDADGRWNTSRTALEESHHLSNPFLFEWRGGLYMIPESVASGEVRLYRCAGSLCDWRLERVLLRDVRAADATLIEHDGRWWMFAAVAHFPWTMPTYELHIFSSDDPIGGNWRAHLANPVCVRADRARPAGAFFRVNGLLVRPAQDCSRGYGRAIRLMEVLELTERAYVEREIGCLRPDEAHGILGTHTVAMSRELRVQDGLTLQLRGRRPRPERKFPPK